MTKNRTVDFAGIEFEFKAAEDIFGDRIWQYRDIDISRRGPREWMVSDRTGSHGYRVEKTFRLAAAAALEMLSP